ncbi:acetate--CoA ligase family protein [Nocardia callitridis]|uniref:Acetate--CoA ligase family protein n=1 Tax=Nocardia callitridis TaxID=648753 RepID=A0ABP9KQ74_9NOCA
MTTASRAREVPDLTPLLFPEKVAIVGGVSKPTGLGSRTVRHLREAGFPGTILTPTEQHPLTEPVDVAMIGVPAPAVADVLASIDGQARFAVVYSSGFEEVGLAPPKTSKGTQLIGPNTVGLYHAPARAILTFAQAFDALVDCRGGSGAFLVSQSGAFGARVVSAAARYGLHLDGFLGTGNEARFDVCTLARGVLVAARPAVLMLYLEGLRDIAALEALLADARAARIPVVCLLGGLSAAGATAAASHTAAVSADAEVLGELFHAYGATLVHSDRELIVSALGFALLTTAKGRRVGIVTGSGGAGVVASDLLSGAGLALPTLGEGTQQKLAALLPPIASTRNPVDVTAQTIGDDVVLRQVCDVLRESGEVDTMLVIGRETQSDVAGARSGADIPTVLATLDREPADVRPLIETGGVVLPDLDSACAVLAAVTGHAGTLSGEPLRRTDTTPSAPLTTDPSAADSMTLVASAGITVAPWDLATAPEQVEAIGDRIGWPVVLKADTAAAVHKARAGGVRLDVARATAHMVAREMFERADSVIVARQLRSSVELFVGTRHDEQWGAVVSAGLGGANVELMNRTVALPAFLGEQALARRLEEVIFASVADRYVGLAAELAAVAYRLVALTESTGAALVECNPVGWVDGELVALDARVVR